MATFNPIVASTTITNSGTTATFTCANQIFKVGSTVSIQGVFPYAYNGIFSIQSLPIETSTSITRAGTTATLTLNGHGYQTGDTIIISGASPSAYNGTFTVTAATSTITYTMLSDPGGSASVQGQFESRRRFTYIMLSNPGGSATTQGIAQIFKMSDFIEINNNDTLTIDIGAVLTCDTNQTRTWFTINGTHGTLLITNTSSISGNRFLCGQTTGGTTSVSYGFLPTSALFSCIVSGGWIQLGIGNNSAQDFMSPFPLVNGISGGYDFIPCLWVEKVSGSDIYEPWFNSTISYGQQTEYCREGWQGTYQDTQKGKWFRQVPRNEEDMNGSHQMGSHFTTVLKFGEYTTTAPTEGCGPLKIPIGCKVRVPNILLTNGQPSNASGGSSNPGSVLMTMHQAGPGIFNYKNCLFGEWKWVTPNLTECSFDTCGFTYGPTLGTVYSLSVKNCGIHSGRKRNYFNSFLSGTQSWYTTDIRNQVTSVVSAPNSIWDNNVFLGSLNLIASPGVIVTNNIFNATLKNLDTQVGLYINQSPNSKVTNTKNYNCHLQIGTANNLVVDNLQMNMGNAYEIPALIGTVQSSSSTAASTRIGRLPNTWEKLQLGTPYYLKVRSFYNYYDPTWYADNPIIYSFTPYAGRLNAADNSDAHPYWFGAALTVDTNDTAWRVWCSWNNVTLATQPVLPFNKTQIWRSTTWGNIGSNLSGDLTPATVISYLDTTISNNTTYYYTLRYYRDASNYTDSAQQIVIVPNFTPNVISDFGQTTNLCLQSSRLNTAPWAAYNTAPTLTEDGIAGPNDYAGSGTGTKRTTTVTFSAVTSGGRQQTITVSNGQTYTIQAELRGQDTSGVSIDIDAVTGTTSSLNCVVNRKWKQFSFQHTSSSTSMILRFSSNTSSLGKTIYARFQVVLGSTPQPYVNITTPIGTALNHVELGNQSASTNTTANSNMYVLSKGGRAVVDISPKVPNAVGWCEIYIGNSPSFTPDITNMCYSSDIMTWYPGIVFSGPADGVTVKNVTTYKHCAALNRISTGTGASHIFGNGGLQSNIVLKNWNINSGFTVPRIILAAIGVTSTAYWDNFILHNFNIEDSRGYGGILVESQFLCNDMTVQNLYSDAYDYGNISTSMNNISFKGCACIDSGSRYDSAVPNSFPFGIPAAGGINITNTGVSDYIFIESFNISGGFVGLLMNPTSKTINPPYIINGSNIKFDAAGKLYFGAPEEYITFTFPWRIYGQTGWRDIPYKIRGLNMGYNAATCFGAYIEYSVSNDGITFGSFKEMVYSNTGSEIIDSSRGFFLKVRITSKQHFRFTAKSTSFVLNETIGNAASSPTATAIVRKIDTDPVTATAGTIWVDTITGTWAYNATIYSGATSRAAMNGDSVFGPVFPYIQISYLDGLGWFTTTDQTKKYPVLYSNIVNTGLVSGTYVSAYNNSNGVWLESTQGTTSVTLQCPFDDNFTAIVKYRKPGYRFQDNIVNLTREGTNLVGSQVALNHTSASDPGAVNITFTDHETSPVSWKSKLWRFTIQVNDSSVASTVGQWFYWKTSSDALLSNYKGTAFSEMILEDGSYYKTQLGWIDGDSIPTGGVRVIDISGNPLSGFTSMQSNDGTYWTPDRYTGLTFTNLISGSQVVIFNTGTQTEISRNNNTGSVYTYSTIYSSDIVIDYTIIKTEYYPIRTIGVTLSNNILSMPISQVADREYSTSYGLTYNSDVLVDITGKRLTIHKTSTTINLYSFLMESWRDQSFLTNVLFPIFTDGPSSITLAYDWEFSALSGANYLTNGGIRYQKSDNIISAIWSAINSSGDIGDSISLDYDDINGDLYIVAASSTQNFWKGAVR